MSASRRVEPYHREVTAIKPGGSVFLRDFAVHITNQLPSDRVLYLRVGPQSFTVSFRPAAKYGRR